MKILYFDPILGISGDMILASLIDLGVPVGVLKKRIDFVPRFKLRVSRVRRQDVSACHIDFEISKKIKPERFIGLIKQSTLPVHIKNQACTILQRIFVVEKKIHNTKKLHLHELADTDTLLDVVGVLVAIDYLDVDQIYSQAVKAGQGYIKTAEGNMPAFNFATAELLKGFPVQFLAIPKELTTPTGAAIISEIAQPKNDLNLSQINRIGLAAGSMRIKGYPNLLRVYLAELDDLLTDECLVIETNIDDMSPQDYEPLFEQLYKAGALEVFLTPVIMKNTRPGILLSVISPSDNEKIIEVIFSQTTTLGLRMRKMARLKLAREIVTVRSPYGKVRVKTFKYRGKKRFSLEYRDLKKLSLKANKSVMSLRKELEEHVEKILGNG